MATATDTITITVIAPSPLTANASADKTSGNVPLTVSFTGSASGGVPPYSYYWDFGDGGWSTALNPGHIFGIAGVYTVKLTVTDSAIGASVDTLGIQAGVGDEIPWVPILVGGALLLLLLARKKKGG